MFNFNSDLEKRVSILEKLAEATNKSLEKLDSKIDTKFSSLETSISHLEKDLKSNISNLEKDLKSNISNLEKDILELRVEKRNNEEWKRNISTLLKYIGTLAIGAVALKLYQSFFP